MLFVCGGKYCFPIVGLVDCLIHLICIDGWLFVSSELDYRDKFPVKNKIKKEI